MKSSVPACKLPLCDVLGLSMVLKQDVQENTVLWSVAYPNERAGMANMYKEANDGKCSVGLLIHGIVTAHRSGRMMNYAAS